MTSLCPLCHKNEAIRHDYYGFLPCLPCRDKQAPRPGRQAEFAGEDIQEQRRAYKYDIRPPHRKGVLDKGFVERYGEKAAKDRGFTDKEIKEAKYVWDGDDTNSYYKEGN